MTLKLTVGVCRKIGQANYGSASASCNAEVELNSTLEDLDAFHQAAKDGFAACERAVNDQLTKSQGNGSATHRPPLEQPSGNGNGPRPASEKQLDYVRRLASQIEGLGVRGLEGLATNMFGKPVAGLASPEASRLIDVLKGAKDGSVDVQEMLNVADRKV